MIVLDRKGDCSAAGPIDIAALIEELDRKVCIQLQGPRREERAADGRRTHQCNLIKVKLQETEVAEVLTGVDPEPRKLRPDSPVLRIREIKSLRGEHPLEVWRCE